jgi:hypothetical protein
MAQNQSRASSNTFETVRLQQEYANLSLFPDDREIPADAIDSLQVKLSGLELRRPRLFGSCWLACELWQQLGLHEFWDARLAGSREDVACLTPPAVLGKLAEIKMIDVWIPTVNGRWLGKSVATPGGEPAAMNQAAHRKAATGTCRTSRHPVLWRKKRVTKSRCRPSGKAVCGGDLSRT